VGLEREIGVLLAAACRTVSTAESCTGGLIAARITAVPDSSRYFRGSVVAYANDVKVRQLGVSPSSLLRHGAVSERVARQMAMGARRKLRTDFGVGVTGIAGPGGGTLAKPVGLVYIAVAGPAACRARKCLFEGTRVAIRKAAAETALGMLKEELHEQGVRHGKEDR
jgi:PncC family amidohydrolase